MNLYIYCMVKGSRLVGRVRQARRAVDIRWRKHGSTLADQRFVASMS